MCLPVHGKCLSPGTATSGHSHQCQAYQCPRFCHPPLNKRQVDNVYQTSASTMSLVNIAIPHGARLFLDMSLLLSTRIYLHQRRGINSNGLPLRTAQILRILSYRNFTEHEPQRQCERGCLFLGNDVTSCAALLLPVCAHQHRIGGIRRWHACCGTGAFPFTFFPTLKEHSAYFLLISEISCSPAHVLQHANRNLAASLAFPSSSYT